MLEKGVEGLRGIDFTCATKKRVDGVIELVMEVDQKGSRKMIDADPFVKRLKSKRGGGERVQLGFVRVKINILAGQILERMNDLKGILSFIFFKIFALQIFKQRHRRNGMRRGGRLKSIPLTDGAYQLIDKIFT